MHELFPVGGIWANSEASGLRRPYGLRQIFLFAIQSVKIELVEAETRLLLFKNFIVTSLLTVKPRKALLNRFITLSNAEVEEEDMRAELQYTQKRGILYTELDSQKKEIQRLVASHCGFACPDPVQVPKMVEQVNNKLMWLHGSFNIGEEEFPGNAEEKIRSEAATYIWINENCPDLPIPKLRGFGVPGGLSRIYPATYRSTDPESLSNLSNRPMLCHLHQLENWAIPSGIARNMTYTSSDSFYLDLLASHDNRLQYQRNAAYSEEDARTQAKDLVLMRASLHKFTDRYLHNGPFIMQLTDMHASNIFIDKDWNIKHIIDLEWACSLPLGDLLPPFWLTGMGVDQIKGPEYERFRASYEKFTEIFEQEETGIPLHHNGNLYSRAMAMRTALEDGRYWYLNALQTPKGLFNLFRTHLEPFYDKVPKESLCAAESPFWTPGMTSFVNLKLKEFTQYRQEVRDIFNSGKSGRPYY
ncbi:predicted protein [Histoplasma mississippiense (nom. inval.)]|nr:predicted protein [Histoplasma mississippiense (nom. inval.)]EDN05885.1 predicted protein [Histoplasma mississippiense (nom. inval.)]